MPGSLRPNSWTLAYSLASGFPESWHLRAVEPTETRYDYGIASESFHGHGGQYNTEQAASTAGASNTLYIIVYAMLKPPFRLATYLRSLVHMPTSERLTAHVTPA